MCDSDDEIKDTKTLWIHKKLTEQIDKEFDLLGQRMTWLISGNAFLFTAFMVGLNLKTSISSIVEVSTGGVKIPLVVMHPIEKIVILSGIVFLGLCICFVTYVAMAAARQVIEEMKSERAVYEIKLQQEIGFVFPITVPYRKAGTNGSHDLGNIMHRNLPYMIAGVWSVLGIVAVCSILGGDYGMSKEHGLVLSLVFFTLGWLSYRERIAPYIKKVIEAIKSDHVSAVKENARLVGDLKR